MYITLNEVIQLLLLLCEVVGIMLLAFSIFKSNKKYPPTDAKRNGGYFLINV